MDDLSGTPYCYETITLSFIVNASWEQIACEFKVDVSERGKKVLQTE